MKKFQLESELCNAFIKNNENKWDIYPECNGFDMLMFHREQDFQVGIEAKLRLNMKVLEQIIERTESLRSIWDGVKYSYTYKQKKKGPHARAILIPHGNGDNIITDFICDKLGINIFTEYTIIESEKLIQIDCIEHFEKPILKLQSSPGQASPRILSKWRINALKLMIKYEEQGYITSNDAKELGCLRALDWFDPQYMEHKIGRCYKMKLHNRFTSKSPAEGYEKEMLELKSIMKK